MTEIRVIKTEANPDPFGTPTIDVLYLTQYRYDEDWQSQFSETANAVSTTGNRVRKTRYKYTGSTPDPVFDLTGDAPPWILQSDEFYVRDVTGKEIAIYSDSSLTQWNIWGLDNIGKINADTTRNYYLKDHLGSIRVVLNSTNTVISAQDYDAWGYQLENRSYNSSAMKYDFTGKERDNETSYNYFGARYYDSRIGRWGQVEPLLDKYLSFSPYLYTLDNPTNYIDPNGDTVQISGDYTKETFDALKEKYPGLKLVMKKGIIYSKGTGVTDVEKKLKEAIESSIKINFITTTEDFIENNPVIVGMYAGNKINDKGVIIATQYFNLSMAWKLDESEFGSPGENAAFEIIEAFLGTSYNPNEGYTETGHNIVHEATEKLFGDNWNKTTGTIYADEFRTIRSFGIKNEKLIEVILWTK